MEATPLQDVLDVARGVVSGDGWDANIGSGEPATQALAHALLDLFDQHQKLQSAAIRLCNVHRWSYGGPETLRALADRIAESYP